MASQETTQDLGPIATRLRFENPDVNVWEMDLEPGELCRMHRHARDYVLYILAGGRIAVESPGGTSNRFPGQKTYELEVGARAISYVPAGGAESARNVGAAERFRAAIFEIKRPPPLGKGNPGFALTEAVAGREPEPGVMTILENTRIRAVEVTLAPGDETGMRYHQHDAVVFVVEGGRVRLVEKTDDGREHSGEVMLDSSTVLWQPRGAHRNTVNLGDGRYRELRVELR